MKEEIWKDVVGFEGYYQVSNFGNIKSLLNRYHKTKKGEIMSLELAATGYTRVFLSKPIRKRLSVHRIVAEAFIPNPDNKPCINHIDNNRLNNNVKNLEWCTYSENLQHAQKQGRLFKAQQKGGINNGIKAIEMAKNRALALVGTKVNSWTVVKYLGKKPVGKFMRDKLLCKCDCGTLQEIEAIRLIKKEPTNCRKCRFKIKR